jgi:hypothetical protein
MCIRVTLRADYVTQARLLFFLAIFSLLGTFDALEKKYKKKNLTF